MASSSSRAATCGSIRSWERERRSRSTSRAFRTRKKTYSGTRRCPAVMGGTRLCSSSRTTPRSARSRPAYSLEGNGYTVLLARNGLEALAIAAGHTGPIDLVATDVVMPKMNGRPLRGSRSCLETRDNMGVLFMSGYTDDEVMRRGVIDEERRSFRSRLHPRSSPGRCAACSIKRPSKGLIHGYTGRLRLDGVRRREPGAPRTDVDGILARFHWRPMRT